MAWRDLIVWLAVFGILCSLGGLAWLTRHPESPWLDRATSWPVVGEVAWWFRDLYRPPPVVRGRRPAEFSREIVWRAYSGRGGGLALRAEPKPAVPASSEPEQAIAFDPAPPALGVAAPDPAGGLPPLGSGLIPAGPLPGRPADPELLASARALLADGGRELQIGPYVAFSDIDDRDLLAELAAVAAPLEDLYRARYRRRPIGNAAETLVLFANHANYVHFKSADPDLVELPAHGHVGGGLVAMAAGDRPGTEVRATLVHEIVHLLNRRALGPALPPWLDEGMADDFGQAQIGADGRLRPGSLASTVIRRGDQLEISGAWASLTVLRATQQGAPVVALPPLLDLDWRSFVAAERRESAYAEAAFFVRFLLDSGDPTLAAGFHQFLDAVAAGARGGADDLGRFLPAAGTPIGLRFRVWSASLEQRVANEAKLVAASD